MHRWVLSAHSSAGERGWGAAWAARAAHSRSLQGVGAQTAPQRRIQRRPSPKQPKIIRMGHLQHEGAQLAAHEPALRHAADTHFQPCSLSVPRTAPLVPLAAPPPPRDMAATPPARPSFHPPWEDTLAERFELQRDAFIQMSQKLQRVLIQDFEAPGDPAGHCLRCTAAPRRAPSCPPGRRPEARALSATTPARARAAAAPRGRRERHGRTTTSLPAHAAARRPASRPQRGTPAHGAEPSGGAAVARAAAPRPSTPSRRRLTAAAGRLLTSLLAACAGPWTSHDGKSFLFSLYFYLFLLFLFSKPAPRKEPSAAPRVRRVHRGALTDLSGWGSLARQNDFGHTELWQNSVLSAASTT